MASRHCSMGVAAVSAPPGGARRHVSDQGTRRPLRSSVAATVAGRRRSPPGPRRTPARGSEARGNRAAARGRAPARPSVARVAGGEGARSTRPTAACSSRCQPFDDLPARPRRASRGRRADRDRPARSAPRSPASIPGSAPRSGGDPVAPHARIRAPAGRPETAPAVLHRRSTPSRPPRRHSSISSGRPPRSAARPEPRRDELRRAVTRRPASDGASGAPSCVIAASSATRRRRVRPYTRTRAATAPAPGRLNTPTVNGSGLAARAEAVHAKARAAPGAP